MTLDEDTHSGIRGLPVRAERISPRNRPELLPIALQKHTLRSGDYEETNPQLSLSKGATGGHWGSHPHMVHEFVQSIMENRVPYVGYDFAANVCAAGILAHESAMHDGQPMDIPVF